MLAAGVEVRDVQVAKGLMKAMINGNLETEQDPEEQAGGAEAAMDVDAAAPAEAAAEPAQPVAGPSRSACALLACPEGYSTNIWKWR